MAMYPQPIKVAVVAAAVAAAAAADKDDVCQSVP